MRSFGILGLGAALCGCSPALPPLFQQQNACFVEAGLPPIDGLEGGHVMTSEQSEIYTACMAHAGY